MRIRELFDPSKKIDRRIEKVITYDTTDPERLRQEIMEYVATESIEASFERLLDQLDEGLQGGGGHEIGVWVSGFYGSGKSSFTKYLGFALDPARTLDGKPFLDWLQNRFTSQPLRARLATIAKRHPSTVIMLDLASEQLAGAAMMEISSVLYSKVMQWAGYSQDRKVAYLEYMLERDGRLADFEARIPELAKGKTWKEIHNQPLVVKTLASRLASEFYPDIWPDAKAFNEVILDEAVKEDDRVREMIDLINTLRRDIQRSFRHIVEGVEKVQTAFGGDSVHAQTAKSIAVLQVLEDFPVSRENLAALIHPSVESPSLLPQVKEAVEDLLKDPAIPLSEIDGSLRFMSEAVSSNSRWRRQEGCF